ncbi:terminal repeat-encoded protein [Staphylococcus phage VB-SavM-JYL02]|uniref:Terminal repeat-encoded protein n=3 Tax=Kayvirus TaxID=1857843 RepID=A0A3Q9R5E6_9CAUD|nr:terminal repeat-encoded protein [Staphylococcus phage VB_SavM_JYL01]AZU97592.1 terminal repeat-encoded protein [Staphylococcus phage VB-SavM-JYL02]
MNVREVHDVVKSAKSKLLQEQNNINNVMIYEYITEELHRRTQRSGTIQMNNNTASYSNGSYGSLEELREAYDLSSLSTDEIKELLETFV